MNRRQDERFFRFMGSWMAGATAGRFMANLVIRIAAICALWWMLKQMFS